MSKTETAKEPCGRPVNACKKIAVIVAVVLGLIAGLYYIFDSQTLDEIKYNFSLWMIIVLVVMINLISGLCFLLGYLAYQWVKRDFKPSSRDPDLE